MILRLGLTVGALALWGPAASAAPPTATFVQLTDVHLFDADSDEARVANQTALSWAALEINRMVMSGRPIDFVVFTGGLGTEALAHDEVDGAISVLAPILRALLVTKIFWVPGTHAGNSAAAVELPDFLGRLTEAVPQKDFESSWDEPVEANGIQFVALDSNSFSTAEAGADARRQLERLDRWIREGATHVVVFTHSTDLDGDRDVLTGALKRFWKPEELRRRWTELALADEIAAVFAGAVHHPERAVYGQSGSSLGGKRPPKLLAKTWLCPPLGSRRERGLEPGSRGFLRVAVSRSGSVEVDTSWFPAVEAKSRDKEGRLNAGRLALESWRLAEAEKAFLEAVDSADAEVGKRAVEGLRTTRAQMGRFRWRWIDRLPPIRFVVKNWLELLSAAVAIAVCLVARYYHRGIKIVRPRSVTDKAPADLWLAELVLAVGRTEELLKRAQDHWYSTPNRPFVGPSSITEEIAKGLPTIKGVDPSKIYRFLMSLSLYLSWRLESEVAGSEQGATVFVSLKWGWKTRAMWRVPAVGEQPLDLAASARRVASEVLWEVG
jgi:hypothetical protein